jgi:RNA polymerase sigma factor (sigma-70 family)
LVKSYPMAAPAFLVPDSISARLADPALREALLKFARRRLPPGEVDDLVQNTLADALASSSAPNDPSEFRRWVQGIARHKVADTYRRRGRRPELCNDPDLAVADPAPATGELTQWIERELPQTEGAQATLHWLLRESEGETLDEIAREAELPAPRVRQRVSRLRRHFQTRWLALGAAGLALLLAAGWLLSERSRTSTPPPVIARETVSPLDRAQALRENALEQCRAAAFQQCLAGLDQAKALDPAGDSTDSVNAARAAAQAALANDSATPAPQLKAQPKRRAPKQKPRMTPQLLEKEQVFPDQNTVPTQQALPDQNTVPTQQAVPNQRPMPNQKAMPQFNDIPAKSKSNDDRKKLAPTPQD